jgi:hypothetical protein
LDAVTLLTDKDDEAMGTEAERLELAPGSTLAVELSPCGGLTSEDEPETTLEAPTGLLVIMGVDIAGEDPGLPVPDVFGPGIVLELP